MDCKEEVERFCISYLSIYNGSNANNSSVDLVNTENIDLDTKLYKNGDVKTVNNYLSGKMLTILVLGLKNLFSNRVPYLNLSILLIFILNIFYFLKKERYFSKNRVSKLAPFTLDFIKDNFPMIFLSISFMISPFLISLSIMSKLS